MANLTPTINLAIRSIYQLCVLVVKFVTIETVCFFGADRSGRITSHIVNVWRNRLQMQWIHALRILAKMINLISIRYISNKKLPRSPISSSIFTIVCAIGIPVLTYMTIPVPALIRIPRGFNYSYLKRFSFLSIYDCVFCRHEMITHH